MIFLATGYIHTQESRDLISRCAQQDIGHSLKFKRDLRQQQSLLGRALIRGLLSLTTKTHPESWNIAIPEKGPLIATSNLTIDDWYFSISHSHKFVIAAISNSGPIGIDVEKVIPTRDMVHLLSSIFSDDTRLLPQGIEDQYILWTRYEAYCKAVYQQLLFPIPEQFVAFSSGLSGSDIGTLDMSGVKFGMQSTQTKQFVYSICQKSQ